MSHSVLNPSTTVNVSELLENVARSFAPIARLRGICPVVATPTPPLLIHTSLEPMLPAFMTLWLKLLYLLPPASRFEVESRLVVVEEQRYLRLQITTIALHLNPNLLLADTPKVLRLDTRQADASLIYVDLLLDDEPQPVPVSPITPAPLLPEVMRSEKMPLATRQRIEQFVQDGLTLHKIRASASAQDARFLTEIGDLIAVNLGNPAFDSACAARELGLTRTALFRKLKKLTGLATANYIRHVRLCKARDLLEITTLPIGDVAGRVGFSELSYFSHCFTDAFGQTPSDWRKRTKQLPN